MNKFLIFILSLFVFDNAIGQRYTIIADRLIDCKGNQVVNHPTILVENNKIVDVSDKSLTHDNSILIDLTGYTVLPGLMDMHTHILSDGSDFDNDLYQNSPSFRSLRAVKHLSIALQNGFTTIRDLCTEGAGYADVDISRAIDSGYVDGPRVFASGIGIAATGYYHPRPRKQNWEFELPSATQYVSGTSECLKVVREQLNKNVKWIKLFADWGMDPTFTFEEIQTIVEEAKKYPIPVAAHAKSKPGIRDAILAGVKSIEHGNAFDDSLMHLAVKHNVFWCPTLSWEEHYGRTSEAKYAALKKANQMKLKVVCGTDIGGFPWTTNQAKELEYLVKKAGMTNMEAIKTATVNAAELLGISQELGSIEKGFIADIIAVKGNPVDDIVSLQQVAFVMKNGKIYKSPFSK